jgi:hypothetical protein
MFRHKNNAAGEANWGCLCAVCFASRQPSKQEFFVPTRTDLAVKLLKVVLNVGYR